MNRLLLTVTKLSFALLLGCSSQNQTSIAVIGGGASGTMAAIQAARMGRDVIVVEPTTWLGGVMTAAGVSAFDGNYNLQSGLFGEFCDSLKLRYGGADSLSTGWVSKVLFEPSVGNEILHNMVAKEPNITLLTETNLIDIKREDDMWSLLVERGGVESTYSAKVVIDGTELGDVAKKVGVGYDIGMESREVTGEDIAPEQPNDIVQDLTYVAILKDYGADADMTIAKPNGYDPTPFYCSTLSEKCVNPKEAHRMWDKDMMITYGKLPNNKYMINWPIEGNDYYLNIIEMSDAEREKALDKAKNFTLQFVYYLQTELGFKNLGLADDEYPTPDHLPLMPYHRESRRIDGLVRFTLNDAAKPYDQKDPLYRTAIAVGDYPVDHHHARYPKWEELYDLHFYPIPSYSLPLGTLIPKSVEGLVVAEKSVSVSNLINGTTRLQPVVIQIGAAAGALAALAAEQGVEPREVAVRDVQSALLEAGGYIMPYIDLPKDDVHFKALQRIGTTGIMRGVGMNIGWTNVTYFNADSIAQTSELKDGLKEFYPESTLKFDSDTVTVGELIAAIKSLGCNAEITQSAWNKLQLTNYDPNRTITRKEAAVLIDKYLDPFANFGVDVHGNIL